MPLRHLSLITAALLAAPLSAADAPPGVRFQHHDWELVCDNTRTCRAAGYQPDSSESAISVLLTRTAGPGQSVQGQIMLGQYDDTAMPSDARLHIGDQDLGALSFAADDAAATLDAAQVTALLAALRRDSDIAVVSASVADPGRWSLSDRGASAVLLKMDEVQGRLGTRTALARRGDRGEDSVLPALPPPVIKAVSVDGSALTLEPALATRLLPALRASVDGDEECRGLDPGDTAEALRLTRLDARWLLASTLCWRAAYNEGYGFWVVDGEAPEQVRLVTLAGSEHDAGTISAAQKGRGLGDCWWSASWVWDGTDFAPASEATTGLCRLVAAGGAWNLPIWVTQVTR